MTLNFPEYAIKCLKTIENASFEAYFVGGCVRDGILGKKFSDIDITTNALPEDIISLFEHTVPTGIKHGTVTVIIDGNNVEVTTYRTESKYEDSRHPSSVDFVKDIKYDLSRRDFTINAMAYNPKRGLVDLFGGLDDMSKKLIRTVGEPSMRFSEDALRILRAFRFSSTLGFNIEVNTLLSAYKYSRLIDNISGERVLEELYKLSNGSNPSVFADFIDNSGLNSFGIDKLHYNIKSFDVLAQNNADKDMKTALFICMFEHDINVIKMRLKPNNKLYKYILFLDSASNESAHNKTDLKLLLYKYGAELVKLFIYRTELTDAKHASELNNLLYEIEQNQEPYAIHQLDIDGQELIRLGYSGAEIGMFLDRAIRHVIISPKDNQYEKLIKIIEN